MRWAVRWRRSIRSFLRWRFSGSFCCVRQQRISEAPILGREMKLLLAAFAILLLAVSCSPSDDGNMAATELRRIIGMSEEEYNRSLTLGVMHCSWMREIYTITAEDYIELGPHKNEAGAYMSMSMPSEFQAVWNTENKTCSLEASMPEYWETICQDILRDMRDLFPEASVAVRAWDSKKIRLSVGHGRRCDFLITQTSET